MNILEFCTGCDHDMKIKQFIVPLVADSSIPSPEAETVNVNRSEPINRNKSNTIRSVEFKASGHFMHVLMLNNNGDVLGRSEMQVGDLFIRTDAGELSMKTGFHGRKTITARETEWAYDNLHIYCKANDNEYLEFASFDAGNVRMRKVVRGHRTKIMALKGIHNQLIADNVIPSIKPTIEVMKTANVLNLTNELSDKRYALDPFYSDKEGKSYLFSTSLYHNDSKKTGYVGNMDELVIPVTSTY